MSTIEDVRAGERKVQQILAALKNAGAKDPNDLNTALKNAIDECARAVRELESRWASMGVEFTHGDSSIAGQTEKLRREIELIEQAERDYRSRRDHSLAQIAEREKREFRILAIREELRTLVEKAKQQSRHGSVWYS